MRLAWDRTREPVSDDTLQKRGWRDSAPESPRSRQRHEVVSFCLDETTSATHVLDAIYVLNVLNIPNAMNVRNAMNVINVTR